MAVEVGIRELRNRLSYWMDQADDGKEVIVTKRGKPVARIMGAGRRTTLERLIEEGVVTPPSRPKGTIDVAKLPKMRKGTLTEILLEQRRSARY